MERQPEDRIVLRKANLVRVPIRTIYPLINREAKVIPSISLMMSLNYLRYQGIVEVFEDRPNQNGQIVPVSLGFFPVDTRDISILYGIGGGVEFKNIVVEVFYERRMKLLLSLSYRFRAN